mgnify:CR=1 FL=1
MSFSPQQLKEAFGLFDSDNKGILPASDVELLLTGIGFSDVSQQEISAMIKAMDGEVQGTIEYDEFEKVVLRKRAEPGSPEEIWRAFKVFDQDGKGRIETKHLVADEDTKAFEQAVERSFGTMASKDGRGVPYDSWRCTMNNLQATTRLATKL